MGVKTERIPSGRAILHTRRRCWLQDSRMSRLVVLVMCLLLSMELRAAAPNCTTVHADETGTLFESACTPPSPQPDQAPTQAAQDTSSVFSVLDTPQKSISSGIEHMARSIDAFFADETVNYPYSGTYLRYSLQTLFEEGGRKTTLGNLDLSLHLPRTEEKLRLVVESDPQEKQSNLERATTGTSQTETNTYYAGLQTAYGKPSKWQFKPSIGLKLHLPVEYYVRLRAYRDINFTRWNLHLMESAYWFHSTGSGFDSEMQWNYPLSKNLLFRADSLVRRTQEYHRFDLSEIFYLIHTLSERRAVTYSLGFFGNSDPHIHATDYIIQARYRQMIHGDYLFMELVPQIRYRIDNAFTQEDSFLLRFEWLFKADH